MCLTLKKYTVLDGRWFESTRKGTLSQITLVKLKGRVIHHYNILPEVPEREGKSTVLKLERSSGQIFKIRTVNVLGIRAVKACQMSGYIGKQAGYCYAKGSFHGPPQRIYNSDHG